MEQIFKVRSGFKVFFWILAVLCFLLVILFPAGILLIYVAYKAEVRMTDKTLEARWIGRKAVPWSEITELSWLPTRGALNGMMRPLRFVATSAGKTVKGGIPVGAFERTDELIAELQKRSGKTIS